jgi:NAD(P)-dependent dehydrogenase (short-subunit alcohol dehydrogenase family)
MEKIDRGICVKVLITGSSRGLGNGILNTYAEQGYEVYGLWSESYNLSDYREIEEACNWVKTLKIDILINNAGINKIDSFLDINPEDYERIHRLNVYAPFRLCQTVLPHMILNKWGRIVNIGSVWGKLSKSGRASYSSSKFAIDGLTLALAAEFSNKGILANCICPGFIDTDMTRKNLGVSGINKMLERVPINRLANIQEIAEFVYWIGSDENTYVSGQNFAIDGGFSRV